MSFKELKLQKRKKGGWVEGKGTFHAKHEHDQPQGECMDQCCTTCAPISLLGQRHHNAPTIAPAIRHLFRSSPIYLQFSPDGPVHHSEHQKTR